MGPAEQQWSILHEVRTVPILSEPFIAISDLLPLLLNLV